MEFYEEKFEQYYSFNEKECLLRLSLPRYVSLIRSNYSDLHAMIIQEVACNGSISSPNITEMI